MMGRAGGGGEMDGAVSCGVAGEGGPDAWHHSLSFPARTELWFLQVRTVAAAAAAAEGATPPAVHSDASWATCALGVDLRKEKKKEHYLTR